MIITTVGELSDGTLDEVEGVYDCIIYVVRENELIFYVGESANVIERLNWHLGQGNFGWGSNSELGRFIRENLPTARDWQVELLTPEDCIFIPERMTELKFEVEPTGIYLRHARTMEEGAKFEWRQKCSRQDLECRLIRAYRPCLNSVCNSTPTPLPERYQRFDDRSTEWKRVSQLLGLDS
jgi:hypothetical protein